MSNSKNNSRSNSRSNIRNSSRNNSLTDIDKLVANLEPFVVANPEFKGDCLEFEMDADDYLEQKLMPLLLSGIEKLIDCIKVSEGVFNLNGIVDDTNPL